MTVLALAGSVCHAAMAKEEQKPVSEAEAVHEAWEDMSKLLHEDAYRKFNHLHETSPNPSREVRYGLAISLLNKQPKTQANMDFARDLLKGLQSEGDDLSIQSTYFLARIVEYHDLNSNLPEAIRLYKELLTKYPEHPFAEMAAPALVFCYLYDETGTVAVDEKERRFVEMTEIAGKLKDKTARRELNRAIGGYLLGINNDPAKALPFLVEASKIDFIRYTSRIDNYVRVAECARELGQNDLAIEYYKKFLNETTRDARAQLIGERIQELEALKGGAPAPATPAAPAPSPSEAASPQPSTTAPAAVP